MIAATLVLEDGTTFRGVGFGASGTTFGEVVFNTALTGYQEILTDPSYHRQLITMTYPHIGNYGMTPQDAESTRVQAGGLIVREAARTWSSHRAHESLQDHLAGAGVVGIAEIDTRRLVRHIREDGAMRGVISSEIEDADELLRQVAESPGMEGAELASEVSTAEPYEVAPLDGEARFRVVAYDFGMKANIVRLLGEAGCHVTVVPAATPAQDVLAREPDGVFLSNGPGDPAPVKAGIAAITELLPSGVPMFGICLGHQLLGLAAGGTTYKLKFGHRGANHPVTEALAPPWMERHSARRSDFGGSTGGVAPQVRHVGAPRVQITSQNHGFAVDADSLPSDGPFGRVVQTHVNLSDNTNEGLALTDLPAFSVQYHPEAAPGPHDARYLFGQFTSLMAQGWKAA